jgi:hypothetical protein
MKFRFTKPKLKRAPAPTSGAPVGPALFVPRNIVTATYEYFLPYWKAEVETACFWFGVDLGDYQVATTVAVAKLFQTQGNFRVDKDSMRRLSASLSQQGLVNLAQVHTHPSRWVEHSPFDDERAYSTRDGAMSLVWPEYGQSTNHGLEKVGIHEMRAGIWARLSVGEISERIRLVDSLADFRWKIESGGIENDDE